MSLPNRKIVFFNIAAVGHIAPTIEVVRELVGRGADVWYFAFDDFREKIENTGARFVSCDRFLPPTPDDLERKIGRDFASLIEMTLDVAANFDAETLDALRSFAPDVVVADSVCLWGKLIAGKLGVPLVCSTATFAFNRQTARLLKRSLREMFAFLRGVPKVRRKLARLPELGFPPLGLVETLDAGERTPTIVYTSREFQPFGETFSENVAFVGPTTRVPASDFAPNGSPSKTRPLVYVALGSLMNRQIAFYRNCVSALKELDVDVEMAIGRRTPIDALGPIPANRFRVDFWADQLDALRRADVFLTHCGMNSVSESLLCGTPTVLFPLQSEEALVASRVERFGAGTLLKNGRPSAIRAAVLQILENTSFRDAARRLGEGLRLSGGATRAADFIENATRKSE